MGILSWYPSVLWQFLCKNTGPTNIMSEHTCSTHNNNTLGRHAYWQAVVPNIYEKKHRFCAQFKIVKLPKKKLQRGGGCTGWGGGRTVYEKPVRKSHYNIQFKLSWRFRATESHVICGAFPKKIGRELRYPITSRISCYSTHCLI